MFNVQFRSIAAAFTMAVGLGLFQTAVNGATIPLYDANGYVDNFDNVGLNGLVDVGESTAFINPSSNPPSLPPVNPSLLGPIASGLVTGQFDITCSGGDATSGCGVPNDPMNAANIAYAQNNHDFGWAILDATDTNNPFYLSNGGGQSFFTSENFTSIVFNPDPIASQVNRRFITFAYDVLGSGLSMVPGRSYAFVTVLGEEGNFAGQTSVPGEFDLGVAWNSLDTATATLYTQPKTFQLHDPNPFYMDFTTGAIGTQVVTSRIINVVPEPTTALLLIAGGLLVGRRNRRLR